MTTPDGDSLKEWKEKFSPNEEIINVVTQGFEIVAVQIASKVFLLRSCEVMQFQSKSDANEAMNQILQQGKRNSDY